MHADCLATHTTTHAVVPTTFSSPHNCVITKIGLRTLKSPLFWTALTVSSMITFTAIFLTGMISTSPLIALSVLVTSAVSFIILCCKFRNRLWQEVSVITILALTFFGYHTWHHEICSGLTLGAIPLSNQGHKTQFMEKNIKAVLSIVETHEFEFSIFSEPVQKEEWIKSGIRHHHISIPDLSAPTIMHIREAVQFLTTFQNVYVHCQLGWGRSATIVTCYIMKNQPKEFREFVQTQQGSSNLMQLAMAFVKKQRPHVYLTAVQIEAIKNYYHTECT